MGRVAGSRRGVELSEKPRRKETSLPAQGEGEDPTEAPRFEPLTQPQSRGSSGTARAAHPSSATAPRFQADQRGY